MSRQRYGRDHPLDDHLPGNDIDLFDGLCDGGIVLRRGENDDGIGDLIGNDFYGVGNECFPAAGDR